MKLGVKINIKKSVEESNSGFLFCCSYIFDENNI